MNRKAVVRVGAVLLILGSASVIAHSALTASSTEATFYDVENQSLSATSGTTVITVHSYQAKKARIVAIAPDGTVRYSNASRDGYWDVDPVENTSATVEYLTGDRLTAEECGATQPCFRSVVERANLTTGEVTIVHEWVNPGHKASDWHDVDRLDDSTLLIGDIERDRVYAYNLSSDMVEWSWEVQSDYPIGGGGDFPEDWTHINDVEQLDNGLVMVSLRNQDQVVFLDPETGLREDLTLGAEDDYDTMYEQHNPDYIPRSRGGPAVLVADSHNDRIVEYQRTDGVWERTWVWRDSELAWPRDADRLPNGHTLVTDTNGDRVIEVDQEGETVWSVDVFSPYEAERLGTGDESSEGESARTLGLGSRSDARDEVRDTAPGVKGRVLGLVPTKIGNAVAFVLPPWASLADALALLIALFVGIAWVSTELYWSPYSVEYSVPLRIVRR